VGGRVLRDSTHSFRFEQRAASNRKKLARHPKPCDRRQGQKARQRARIRMDLPMLKLLALATFFALVGVIAIQWCHWIQ
jgi:hypothetical protein